jgi:hypothetical protein
MKTKLFKIVKKRYKIVEISHIEDPNSGFIQYKLPIYVVYDKDCVMYEGIGGSAIYSTYAEAFIKLVKEIHKEFYSLMKRKDDKITKVWHK